MPLRTKIATLLLVVIAAQPMPVRAADGLAVATLKLYPWGFYDREGQPTGLLYEATNAILTEAGLPMENKILPMRRAMKSLAMGDLDLVALFIVPDFSDVLTHRVGRIAVVDNVVVGRRGTDLAGAEGLAGLSVAEPLGYMNDKVPDAYRRMDRVAVRDYTLAIEMLVRKRVDAVAGPFVALRCAAVRHDFLDDDFGRPYKMFVAEIWLQMSRKSKAQHLLPRLRAAAKRVAARGTFADLFKLIDCSR